MDMNGHDFCGESKPLLAAAAPVSATAGWRKAWLLCSVMPEHGLGGPQNEMSESPSDPNDAAD